MGLLHIRDELATARDFLGCLYLACQNVEIPHERAALCAVSYAVREKLQAIDAALVELIGGDQAIPTNA